MFFPVGVFHNGSTTHCKFGPVLFFHSFGLSLSFNPVWSRSVHAHRLDPALNDSCRIITGCLKPTNTNCLYLLDGIAPPDIRREVASRRERQKARHDPSHMLYQGCPTQTR